MYQSCTLIYIVQHEPIALFEQYVPCYCILIYNMNPLYVQYLKCKLMYYMNPLCVQYIPCTLMYYMNPPCACKVFTMYTNVLHEPTMCVQYVPCTLMYYMNPPCVYSMRDV